MIKLHLTMLLTRTRNKFWQYGRIYLLPTFIFYWNTKQIREIYVVWLTFKLIIWHRYELQRK